MYIYVCVCVCMYVCTGHTRYRLMRDGRQLFNTVPKLCGFFIGTYAVQFDLIYLVFEVCLLRPCTSYLAV